MSNPLDDAAAADLAFSKLPPEAQWPSLSPAYARADACREPGALTLSLRGYRDASPYIYSVHENRVPGLDAADWQSPYGYGGAIFGGLDEAACRDAWAETAQCARDRGVIAEFVRFHPGLDAHQTYPGRVKGNRSVVMLDLRQKDLLGSDSGRARTAVRKAERVGLQWRWLSRGDALAQFPAFYRECMRQIDAGDFYLFEDPYFKALLALPQARVLMIHREEAALSMGLFLFGPLQMEYHLSGTSPAGRELGATNLLLHLAATQGQSQECRHLYLGGGVSAAEDDPLLRFKSSFAPAVHTFRIGYRVFDEEAYARLRAAHRIPPGEPRRILFYRQ